MVDVFLHMYEYGTSKSVKSTLRRGRENNRGDEPNGYIECVYENVTKKPPIQL
jgi:hypothetical protein